MYKELNIDFINNFTTKDDNFSIKTEIAYIIGQKNLDSNFKEFINNETCIDGIYGFSVLVDFLCNEYAKNTMNYWDIYEFVTNEYENYFEKFKKVCFK